MAGAGKQGGIRSPAAGERFFARALSRIYLTRRVMATISARKPPRLPPHAKKLGRDESPLYDDASATNSFMA